MSSVFRVYFSHLLDDEEEKTENDDNICVLGVVADTPEEAIKKVKKKVHSKVIEIEVENEHDALTAAHMNVDVIMLDNFNPKTGGIAAKKIRQINPRILIEVSGSITPENIEQYASFADRISLGYLTHSVKNKDFSLEITDILGNV